jgi:hypothetical protein
VLQLYITIMCSNMHLCTHRVMCFRALLITYAVPAGQAHGDCECL